MSTPTVTVWSRPRCVQCDATKRRFDGLGIPYTERTLTPEKAAEYRDAGYAAAPIVTTELGTWAGYQHDNIKRLAAHRRNT